MWWTTAPCATASSCPTASCPHRGWPAGVQPRLGVENGKAKPFDQVVTDIPIGSGPYKIGPVQFGKDITYVRDPQYWARDLNVRKGTANFDRILVKIYKDSTARARGPESGRV